MEPTTPNPASDPRFRAGAIENSNSLFGNSLKRISWGAILAGVLIAVVIQISLSLLGLGIGLSTIDPKTDAHPLSGLGIGSAIWYIVSSLIALYAGGWIAGRLSPTKRLFDGIIHGILAWSLVTLVTLYFLTTTLGSILGGVGKLVGNTLGVVGAAAGSGIAAAAPAVEDAIQEQGIDLSDLKNEAETLLRQTGKSQLQPNALSKQADMAKAKVSASAGDAAENPAQAGEEADGLINRLLKQGKGVTSQVDKEAAVNVIVARTGKSHDEAAQIVDNWVATSKEAAAKIEETKKEVKAKAIEVADQAAKAASTAAILTFVSLLLGAAIAGFGAKQGSDSKEDVSAYDRPVSSR